MLVAFSLPVTFFISVFRVKFLAMFEVVAQKQSDFSTVIWVADREEIRQVNSTEILSNTATMREVTSTEIEEVFT